MLIQNYFSYEDKFTNFNSLTLTRILYLVVFYFNQLELIFEYLHLEGLKLFLYIYKYFMNKISLNILRLRLLYTFNFYFPLKINNYTITENELIVSIIKSKPYLNFFLFIFRIIEPFYLSIFWYKKINMFFLPTTLLVD